MSVILDIRVTITLVKWSPAPYLARGSCIWPCKAKRFDTWKTNRVSTLY